MSGGPKPCAKCGIVIFDEFHERGVNSDVALALCREAQAVLRPELRLCVMSATLLGDGTVADGATIVKSSGRAYPVEVAYPPRGAPRLAALLSRRGALEDAVIEATERALRDAPDNGDIPDGRRCPRGGLCGSQISRRSRAESSHPTQWLISTQVASALRERTDVNIETLYGAMPAEAQDAVVHGRRRGRRVVVASPIAEASLTLEGVTAVVDSGSGESRRSTRTRACGADDARRVKRRAPTSGRAARAARPRVSPEDLSLRPSSNSSASLARRRLFLRTSRPSCWCGGVGLPRASTRC